MGRTSTRKRTLSDASTASTVLGDVAPFEDDAPEMPLPRALPCAPTGDAGKAPEAEARRPKAPEAEEARRSDASIADCELDVVYEDIYSQMENEAMLEILADLERELVPAYLNGSLAPTTASAAPGAPAQASSEPPAAASKKSSTEQLLWHITATPAMMRDLARAHVASCDAGATVSVGG